MHTYIIINIFTLWSSIFELMMLIKIEKKTWIIVLNRSGPKKPLNLMDNS